MKAISIIISVIGAAVICNGAFGVIGELHQSTVAWKAGTYVDSLYVDDYGDFYNSKMERVTYDELATALNVSKANRQQFNIALDAYSAAYRNADLLKQSIPKCDDRTTTTNNWTDSCVGTIALYGSKDASDGASSGSPKLPCFAGSTSLTWKDLNDFFEDANFSISSNGKAFIKGLNGNGSRIVISSGGGETTPSTLSTKTFESTEFEVGTSTINLKKSNASTTVNDLLTNGNTPDRANYKMVARSGTGNNETFQYIALGDVIKASVIPDGHSVNTNSSSSVGGKVALENWLEPEEEEGSGFDYKLADVLTNKAEATALQNGYVLYRNAASEGTDAKLHYLHVGMIANATASTSAVADGKTINTNDTSSADGSLALNGTKTALENCAGGGDDTYQIPYLTGDVPATAKLAWDNPLTFFNTGVFQLGTTDHKVTLKGLGNSENARVMIVTGTDTPDVSSKEFDGASLIYDSTDSKIRIKGWNNGATTTANIADYLQPNYSGAAANFTILGRDSDGNTKYLAVGNKIALPNIPSADEHIITTNNQGNLTLVGYGAAEANQFPIKTSGTGGDSTDWVGLDSGSFERYEVEGYAPGDYVLAGWSDISDTFDDDEYPFPVRYKPSGEGLYPQIAWMAMDDASIALDETDGYHFEIAGYGNASTGQVPVKVYNLADDKYTIEWRDLAGGGGGKSIVVDDSSISTNISSSSDEKVALYNWRSAASDSYASHTIADVLTNNPSASYQNNYLLVRDTENDAKLHYLKIGSLALGATGGGFPADDVTIENYVNPQTSTTNLAVKGFNSAADCTIPVRVSRWDPETSVNKTTLEWWQYFKPDCASITTNEMYGTTYDGANLELYGFADAQAGKVPKKTADGKLEWGDAGGVIEITGTDLMTTCYATNKVIFASAQDCSVEVTPSYDSMGGVKLTVGVYYK